ncbi:MAG: hypothetical protein JRI25_00095 [Deltaproteobacteria bacterium]|nr:hypothetical protein [Deltaproteobacteria bacterium]MBW2252977.1 hypothetical protein [Deltaproteobacteria bacterium]
MKTLLLLVLLSGCQQKDPDLVAFHDALEAWERGVTQLESGDPEAARSAFQEAQSHRPEDALLAAWEAKAAADAGELEVAASLLDRALVLSPGFAEARYNRAAYWARLGRPTDEVAREVRQAVQDGARRSREVLQDPDFQDLLDDPSFDFLPSQSLTIVVEAPQSTVFWGSEFGIRFRLVGAESTPIAVTAERIEGPVELLSVVDDSRLSTQGTVRDLTWTFRVVGAGPIHFGPFHAWVGERRSTVEEVWIDAAAPAGKEIPPERERLVDFRTPMEVAGRAEIPSARVVDGELLVGFAPGDRVVIEPKPAAPPVQYEQRYRSKAKWTLLRYPGVEPGEVKVTVQRGGRTVYEGP